MARLPNAAQGFGVVAVLAMQGWLPYPLVYVAAVCDLLAAAILINWIALRVRMTLGSPHPGWRWYGVALGCLILALLSVLLIPFWQNYWQALRLFHMHLNTLGLVGLAALGTLPVLMPTALGKPDPEAASWLRRRLWLVASGALVVATGVVIAWPFATPGALLILVCALGLAGHWSRRFGLKAVLMDGVAASLFASVVGLMVSRAGWFFARCRVFADTTIAVCVGRRFFAALGDRGLESVVAGMALAGAGHSGARHHAAKTRGQWSTAWRLVPGSCPGSHPWLGSLG